MPQRQHTTRAGNVVIFELLAALARVPGSSVSFLRIGTESSLAVMEQDAGELRQASVEVLDPLALPAPPLKRAAWRKLAVPRRSDFYPLSVHAGLLQRRIDDIRPDILFVPWDEQLTALAADIRGPVKFAYYGNPDQKAGTHRAAFDRRHGISPYSWLRSTLYLRRLEQAHLDVMRRYELVGDVAANDAEYYVRQGHPNAFYVRNVWIDRFGEEWRSLRRQRESRQPAIIAANVGNVSATANRYGLELLGNEFVPELRNVMSPGSYEVHVFGAGELLPQLRAALNVQEVKIRGFVADIDDELLRSQVFLCLNNASPYKVGHTRYLHAWSLGCPVVAHTDAALSMPEIVHGENALLGTSAQQIAAHVQALIADSALRRRIGEGGYATFRSCFMADRVAPQIVERMVRVLAASPDRPASNGTT
jgi:glycosyltransferase involved in cell wall biosynthesis